MRSFGDCPFLKAMAACRITCSSPVSKQLLRVVRGSLVVGRSRASSSSLDEKRSFPSAQHSPHKAPAQNGMVDPRTGKARERSGWDYRTELAALASRLGYPKDGLPSLLQALTLKPFVEACSSGSPDTDRVDNSRLSALGASALQLYLVEHLYCTFPRLQGGDILSLCAALSNPTTLAVLGERLGVVDLIRTTHCLYNPTQVRVIGRAVAAVVGAVYVDHGSAAARELVRHLVVAELVEKDAKELICFQHPKLVLTEVLKQRNSPPPVTRIVRESGRLTHFPTFVVGVYSGDKCLGEGAGTSIKRAESEALGAALREYFLEEIRSGPFPSDMKDYQDEKNIKLFSASKEASGEQEAGLEPQEPAA